MSWEWILVLSRVLKVTSAFFFFFFLEKINRHIESRVNRACIDISHFI